MMIVMDFQKEAVIGLGYVLSQNWEERDRGIMNVNKAIKNLKAHRRYRIGSNTDRGFEPKFVEAKAAGLTTESQWSGKERMLENRYRSDIYRNVTP